MFFDALGIAWEYEPQGFEIGWSERRWMYLPDFWLPDLGLWVEVKGSETQIDYDLILAAVVPHQGLPLDPSGTPVPDPSRVGDRMLILGPVSRALTGMQWHCLLQFWKGDVFQEHVTLHSNHESRWVLRKMNHNERYNPDYESKFGDDSYGVCPGKAFLPLTATITAPIVDARHKNIVWDRPLPAVVQAYTAALSARFEHGQRGPT